MSGCITFHYHRAIDNQPLKNPVKVRAVLSNDLLELEDGRRVQIDQEIADLEARITESEYEVEVLPRAVRTDGVIQGDVFVKEQFLTCGSPWATTIKIPLIADEIERWGRFKLEPR